MESKRSVYVRVDADGRDAERAIIAPITTAERKRVGWSVTITGTDGARLPGGLRTFVRRVNAERYARRFIK